MMVRTLRLVLGEFLRFVGIAAGVAATIVFLDIRILDLGADRVLFGAASAYFSSWLCWASWKKVDKKVKS